MFSPAPVQSCRREVAGRLHGVRINLHREGEEGGAKLLLVSQEENLADNGQLGLDGVMYGLRSDVLPSGRDEDFFDPSGDGDKAVVVNHAHIAAPQESVLTIVKGSFRLLRLLQIPREIIDLNSVAAKIPW